MSSQPDIPTVDAIADAVRHLQGVELPAADRHDAVAGAARAVAAVDRAARKLLRWDAVARPDAELMQDFAAAEGGDAERR
ncbi:MAG TPA: hypothetical protein VGD08_19460 [Stellaceae bacterium]